MRITTEQTVVYISCIIVVLIIASLPISCARADFEDEKPVAATDAVAIGPLTISVVNPRYFEDGAGKTLFLTGSHTWNNFQDMGYLLPVPFGYAGYLNFLKSNNHNFFRLWTWEQGAWISTLPRKMVYSPLPYMRTGPGKAIDGKLKFDIMKYNEAYFARLRSRVLAARNKGIYVSVMLFNGFSVRVKEQGGPNPWNGHPFNAQNNINGVDGDPGLKGDGRDTHTLNIPEITTIQENYVKKVIDTVNDLDNVLWEVSNESDPDSTDWQYHMIDFIRAYETAKGKKHPVLMTFQWPGGSNLTLFNSSAEAISPNEAGGYKDNPPTATGQKVIISDTDHLWGVGGDYVWVWKSFLRGLNPIFMDPYKSGYTGNLTSQQINLVRKNMGYTLSYANRVNLANMQPARALASSGYCLAEPGRDYIVYAPGGTVTVDLSSGGPGTFAVEWLDVLTGKVKKGTAAAGGDIRVMTAPFTGDAVLYLHAN